MSIASVSKSSVYRFSAETTDGEGSMKALLGGKGAGLAVMARLGVPVPPGFTIPTSVCSYFYAHDKSYPTDLQDQVEKALDHVGKLTGKGFGEEAENVSTRVSVQRPDFAIPRGNTPVHADYSSEAHLFSLGTLAPRVLTMLSSAASAFASSGLTGAFLQRGSFAARRTWQA